MNAPNFPIVCVRNRPIISEPLVFFGYETQTRLFLTIAKDPQVWQDDLTIGEKIFSDVLICPYGGNRQTHLETVQVTKDILKQRMKYPGIQENPSQLELAKIWVLPTKVHMGPDAETFLQASESSIRNSLEPHFNELKNTNSSIQIMKIEVGEGNERSLIYKFMDEGFRPSLLLVKWSYDLDEHIATAHCAGHLMNIGYRHVSNQNGYSLYYFTDEPLYDICSMKDVSLENPMMQTILESVNEGMKKMAISDSQVPSEAPSDKATAGNNATADNKRSRTRSGSFDN
jgi:hypothetical protein